MYVTLKHYDRNIMNAQSPLEVCADIVSVKSAQNAISIEFEDPHLNAFLLASLLFDCLSAEKELHAAILSSPVWSSTQDFFPYANPS